MMCNERGSAIALVLLMLGLLTMLAVGVMVQARMDTKIVRAQRQHDKALNLADGAASMAFVTLAYRDTGEFTGRAVHNTEWSSDGDDGMNGSWSERLGKWTATTVLKGYETSPAALAGWGLGADTGYHIQYWIAEGTGAQLRSASETPSIDSAVLVPSSRIARN
jgi:hypothetical protein